MTVKNLLVELFVEELPPKALKKLGEAFASALAESLKAQGLASGASGVANFASPRRLAAHVTGVASQAADKSVSQKLMPVSVGLDAAGSATPALLKRLAGLGAEASAVASLKRAMDGKAEALFYESIVKGATLAAGAAAHEIKNALGDPMPEPGQRGREQLGPLLVVPRPVVAADRVVVRDRAAGIGGKSAARSPVFEQFNTVRAQLRDVSEVQAIDPDPVGVEHTRALFQRAVHEREPAVGQRR